MFRDRIIKVYLSHFAPQQIHKLRWGEGWVKGERAECLDRGGTFIQGEVKLSRPPRDRQESSNPTAGTPTLLALLWKEAGRKDEDLQRPTLWDSNAQQPPQSQEHKKS